MKRRVILWVAAGAAVLLYVQCNWVVLPLRRPDAVITMKTTGYCACRKCCSWKYSWYGMPVFASGPRKGKLKMVGQTASGYMARPGTVAVDPDLFPMGTLFYIPGYGRGIARDTGGGIKGKHIDLYFRRHSSGEKWGVQTKRVKVWYPRN